MQGNVGIDDDTVTISPATVWLTWEVISKVMLPNNLLYLKKKHVNRRFSCSEMKPLYFAVKYY
jgi:hypothetical protein